MCKYFFSHFSHEYDYIFCVMINVQDAAQKKNSLSTGRYILKSHRKVFVVCKTF